MLGLRLDEPLPLREVEPALDAEELRRLRGAGLVIAEGDSLALTRRGRFLGGGVTARLLAPTMSA
jgi:coproporphyrinogen III oxidase-like Fe-S oxidoreductase